jgi:GPH family glycoside/pentoside/hexuronide:cation symporter
MISLVPGILYMSCANFLYFYNIERETEVRMQEELETRKSQG